VKILVLGSSGMLGGAVTKILSENDSLKVFGTVRSSSVRKFFPLAIADRLITVSDLQDHDILNEIFERVQPEVVINCISLSKKLLVANDPLNLIPIYAVLPHRLAAMCQAYSARLVQISSDGVFSGAKGGYTEDDTPDAKDLYGMTKYLGEVQKPYAVNLRTSIIGHELQSTQGLVDWFLSQQGQCRCFSRAIFSGLPTVVLAQIIRDIVIPRDDLTGVYHVAADPISKYDLLRLVAEAYGKSIEIVPDDKLVIDRSLNPARFRAATGYVAPDWPRLIETMRSYHEQQGTSYV
jgi:dTDP-4-dehydrorhamnose reductase